MIWEPQIAAHVIAGMEVMRWLLPTQITNKKKKPIWLCEWAFILFGTLPLKKLSYCMTYFYKGKDSSFLVYLQLRTQAGGIFSSEIIPFVIQGLWQSGLRRNDAGNCKLLALKHFHCIYPALKWTASILILLNIYRVGSTESPCYIKAEFKV